MPEASDSVRLRAEYANRARRLAGSDKYSPFDVSDLFMRQQREREVLRLLRRTGYYPLTGHAILEVGCGGGGVLLQFLGYGAEPYRLCGCDLLSDRLVQARSLLPQVAFACADAQTLPFRSDSFDLLLQFTVFSSILDDAVKANLAGEMLRVLKPGGAILWYDFWLNPTNPQTRGVLPDEVRRLFQGCHFKFQRVTLAPPLTRRLVRISWILCAVLEKIKLFNTHYLAIVTPEGY